MVERYEEGIGLSLLLQSQDVITRFQVQNEAKNYQKQRRKVARLHEKIVNARTDHLHKIIKNHDVIGIEDLQVSNMLKNRKLSKVIREVS